MKYTKGKWITKTGQYQSGEYLYINRICVGDYDWNSCRSRDSTETDRYVGNIVLPSIKNKRVFGDSPEEVKLKVERIVNAWFKEALAKAEGVNK